MEKEVNGMREVGKLVGGSVEGRLEGGGMRFPKKIGVRGGAKKNMIKKINCCCYTLPPPRVTKKKM